MKYQHILFKILISIIFLCPVCLIAYNYQELDTGWNDVPAMTTLDGKLYIVCGEGLFEVDKKGNYQELDTGWDDVSAMTALDGKLYIVCGEGLFEVDAF